MRIAIIIYRNAWKLSSLQSLKQRYLRIFLNEYWNEYTRNLINTHIPKSNYTAVTNWINTSLRNI